MSKQTIAKLPLFFILAVFFFILNVVAPVFQPSQSGLAGKIGRSMQSTAFAEADVYGYCYNAGFTTGQADNCADIDYQQVICMVAGSTTTINSFFNYADVSDVPGQQTGVDIVVTNYQDTGVVASPLAGITPASQTYAWNAAPIAHAFDVTAPTISTSLPYLSIPIYSSVELLTTSGEPLTDAALTNLIVLHPNSAPTLTNPTPGNYSATINGNSVNFPVTIDHNDINGDSSTLTFQLSKDNFATIEQSAVYNSVAAGATQQHAFTGLTQGSYSWRVLAEQTESTLPDDCDGAAYLDPLINLDGASVLSATSAVEFTAGSESNLASTGSPVLPAALAGASGLLTAVALFIRRIKS